MTCGHPKRKPGQRKWTVEDGKRIVTFSIRNALLTLPRYLLWLLSQILINQNTPNYQGEVNGKEYEKRGSIRFG